MRDQRGFFRTSDPGTYSFERLKSLNAEGRLYAPYDGEVIVDESSQRVFASKGGNIGVKYYLEERGRNRYILTRAVDNLWDDIAGLGTVPGEDENYPTQKTQRLLQRILETASRPGDLILDPFAGSGTTLAVARKLGRNWIGCDSSWRAVRTSACRLTRCLSSAESAFPVGAAISRKKPASGEDGSQGNNGYRLLRIGPEDAANDGIRPLDPTGRPTANIILRQVDGRQTVRIEGFHSPQVAGMAAEAEVSLPRDWRAQVRAVLVDPDYDGVSLQAALVDAPAGKSALVAGVYSFDPSVNSDRKEDDSPPDPAVAVLIIDVAGQEHLFVDSAWQSTFPGHSKS